MRVRIRKGLDLPFEDRPVSRVESAGPVRTVALAPPDHPGLRARLEVAEGEVVACGQTLFVDRRDPAIRFVAPRAGRVARIHRDAQRALQAVVVSVGVDAAPAARVTPFLDASPDHVRRRLLEAGLWPALRTRPFGQVPRPDARADAVFVTAMDTNPGAGDVDALLPAHHDDLQAGARVLAALTSGPVYVCAGPDASLPDFEPARVEVVCFDGPHPAGLPGTHMQHLLPPRGERVAWYLDWQELAAFGRLASTGRVWDERYVALSGPRVKEPRWVTASPGASVGDLLADGLREGPCRILSGSVLSGRQASGWGAWLGRHHRQVSVVSDPNSPRTGGWSSFGALWRRRRGPLTTALHGVPMPMIPVDRFERLVPLDILPTALLRALLVEDLETAEQLGCLELEPEDLALCSFACPSKIDYGALLRRALDALASEREEATA